MKHVHGLAAAALLLVPTAGAPVAGAPTPGPQEESPPAIAATHVAGAVHVIVGRGGNIGVSAGPDGLLIVDTQFEFMAPAIRAALAAVSDDAPIEFVVNTHWHADHTGGNAVLGAGVPILAHENVRARMATVQQTSHGERGPSPSGALPSLTYADGVTLHFNGEPVRVLHLPSGHTDGDSVVHFTGSNVAHLGDLFFVDSFPYVDRSSGGSVRGIARNVGRLLELLPEDVKLVPGHGPVATKEDLRAYHGMLTAVLERVRRELDAGRTLEELRDADVLAEWSSWGEGFIDAPTFLGFVVADLAADAPADGEDEGAGG